MRRQKEGNIQHRTSNIQHPTCLRVPTGHWMLDVGCSMLDVFLAAPARRAAFQLAAGLFIAPLLSAVAAPAEAILLRSAVVHTVSGETLSPGDVLVQDGKIAAVGKSLPARDAKVIELKGQHVYPGL